MGACVPRAPEVDDVITEGVEKSPIVGGSNTTIQQHPWQVSLQSLGGSHFCGGSIIDASWILTAAHCVDGSSAGSLRIAAGMTRRSQSTSGQIRGIAQIIEFPGFFDPSRGRDAALLRLTSPLNLNGSTVQTIAIATPAHASAGLTNPGVNATVTGWGSLRSGGPSPDVLQAVSVPIVSNAQAQNAYPGEQIGSDQLGAGLIGTGGRDSCQGDSGGPLTVPDGNGGRLLAGVVSWGYGCADRRWPGMYARVSAFASWIQTHVNPNVAPTVSIVSPAANTTVSGSVTVQASAADSDGSIVRVTFTFPDGTVSNDTSSPYSATWNSTQFADGAGVIRVQAFDDDGAGSPVVSLPIVTQNGNQSCASGTHPSLNAPTAIPDNSSTGITSSVMVSGGGTVTTLSLSLDITHTWRGDLAVQLVSPSGTTAIVHNRGGGSADDLVIIGQAITDFAGETASGAWQLRVQDLAGQDVGTLDSWSLDIVANCTGGGGGNTGGWSASATPNVATVDNGQVCDSVTVSGSGDAADVQLDISGQHAWRSILRATLSHDGTTVEAFGTGTFPRQGGSFSLTDHVVAGFSGSAAGTWTLCLIDTDAFGDTGTLAAWSVHD